MGRCCSLLFCFKVFILHASFYFRNFASNTCCLNLTNFNLLSSLSSMLFTTLPLHHSFSYMFISFIQVLESTDHINSCKPISCSDPSYKETLEFLQKMKARYTWRDAFVMNSLHKICQVTMPNTTKHKQQLPKNFDSSDYNSWGRVWQPVYQNAQTSWDDALGHGVGNHCLIHNNFFYTNFFVNKSYQLRSAFSVFL